MKDIKKLLPLIILAIVILAAVVIVLRILAGGLGLVKAVLNTVLGLVVIIALIAIVIWMFRYAKLKK